MSIGLIATTRAAASSSASGMPSRRLQMSATAAALLSSTTKPGRTARARSLNSTAASAAVTSSIDELSGTSSERSGHVCSPGTPSASRLVARIPMPGHALSTELAKSRAGRRRCSQLSRTTSSCLARRNSTMLASSDSPARALTPKVTATICAIDSRSSATASSHSQAPSGKRGSTSAATWIASRVFPTPPTPVMVTRRASRSAVAIPLEVLLAADERRQLRGKVARERLQRPKRRELGLESGRGNLEQAFRP